MKYKQIFYIILFFIPIVLIKIIGYNNIPTIFIILLFIIIPIYFIWMINKYSEPGKIKKYRIKGTICGGIILYATVTLNIIDKCFHTFFEEYRTIIEIVFFIIFIIALIIAGMCSYQIKYNEESNRLL